MKINNKILNESLKWYWKYWISKEEVEKDIKELIENHFLEWNNDWTIKSCMKNTVIQNYLYHYNKENNHRLCFWSDWNNNFYIHRINYYRLSLKDVKKLENHFWIN